MTGQSWHTGNVQLFFIVTRQIRNQCLVKGTETTLDISKEKDKTQNEVLLKTLEGLAA